jgi:aspartyl-tRNA(Asn)/glutamyl-tRNA(Gln) amidotransferase subunit C
MSLSREEVLHVSQLARVGLSEAEIDSMRDQLNHIIDQFTVLQEIDTSNVPPTAQVFVASNTLREDAVGDPAPVEKILQNAPRSDGEYLRVRAVLED